MKKGHKLFVAGILLILPCLYLFEHFKDYIFIEDSFLYRYRQKHHYYKRDPLPKIQSENYNQKLLNQLVEKINQGKYKDVHSLIILQNDSLVAEEYFNYQYRDRHLHLYDMTTIFLNSLLGILIEQKNIKGINEKILDFFPEYSYIANYDRRKEDVIIADLLTNRAGFDWRQRMHPFAFENYYRDEMHKSGDYIKYYLDRPMREKPGNQFEYTGGSPTLISAILAKKIDSSFEYWTIENFFSKFGVTYIDWDTHSAGNLRIGGMLEMRPIDMACFGLLYLNNGRWNGKEVISEDWILSSTKAWIQIENNREFGWSWYRYSKAHEINNHVGLNDIYFASGFGGKFLWVIPHLNMVVVTTGDGPEDNPAVESMLWEYILPAFYK